MIKLLRKFVFLFLLTIYIYPTPFVDNSGNINKSAIEIINLIVPNKILNEYKKTYKDESFKIENIINLTQGRFDKKYSWMRKNERYDIKNETPIIHLNDEKIKKIIKIFQKEDFFNSSTLSEKEVSQIKNNKNKTNVIIFGSTYHSMKMKCAWIKEYFKSIKLDDKNINYIFLGGTRKLIDSEIKELEKLGFKDSKDEGDMMNALSKDKNLFPNGGVNLIFEKLVPCENQKRATTMTTLNHLKKNENIIRKNEIILFVSMQPFISRQGLMASTIFTTEENYNVISVGPGIKEKKIPKKFPDIYKEPKIQVLILLDELSRFFYTIHKGK